MKESYEPIHGPLAEVARMYGPRGYIQGFDKKENVAIARLTSEPNFEVKLRGCDYTHLKMLKGRPYDGFLGDQLDFESLKELYESDVDETSGLFNAIILEREPYPVEMKHFYTGRWALVFISKPRVS